MKWTAETLESYSSENRFARICEENIRNLKDFVDDTTIVFDILENNFDETMCYITLFDKGIHLNSAQNTLCSILACAKLGNFADANMLVRKYRDDLFQFLYFNYVIDEHKKSVVNNPKGNKAEMKVISYWYSNKISELKKDDYKKILSADNYKSKVLQDNIVKSLCNEFFNETWEQVNKIANDYTHSNNIQLLKNNSLYQDETQIKENFSQLEKLIRLVTVYFISILYIKKGYQFRSSDYIGYLDVGITPPENSQYWVPDCVNVFFNKYIQSDDVKLKEYLIEEGLFSMDIE